MIASLGANGTPCDLCWTDVDEIYDNEAGRPRRAERLPAALARGLGVLSIDVDVDLLRGDGVDERDAPSAHEK
jgi:hypothetical protein